jgi:hypothetical protein
LQEAQHSAVKEENARLDAAAERERAAATKKTKQAEALKAAVASKRQVIPLTPALQVHDADGCLIRGCRGGLGLFILYFQIEKLEN